LKITRDLKIFIELDELEARKLHRMIFRAKNNTIEHHLLPEEDLYIAWLESFDRQLREATKNGHL